MWKLKLSEGNDVRLESANNHIGRQYWKFDRNPGTPQEQAQVEKARDEFKKNRFHDKQSSDLLMRLQFAKENPCEMKLPQVKVKTEKEMTDEAVATTLRKALRFYSTLQTEDGFWPGDYGGPLFLLPGLVIGLSITGALNAILPLEHRHEILRYLYNHQNIDGGWGLHIEGTSTMFCTALCYVTLRLLGEAMDGGDGSMEKARKWILDHGGVTYIPSWGKMWLSVLGVYEWSGNNPLPPEIWLLPYSLPIHPGRMWCHCRMVYLPMSYLYGRRYVGPINSIILSLRRELYTQPFHQINWDQARNLCAKEDLYCPHSKVQDMLWGCLDKVAEPLLMQWPFSKLRQKALDTVMQHIHYEDENTRYICIGPVNKVLNMVCRWVEDPNSEAYQCHLERIKDYLWVAEDGMKMQGYNGSQLWDVALAAQAILATDLVDEYGSMLKKAHNFIKNTQVRTNSSGDLHYWYRHISKGGWPFSTPDNGWIVSDCTAEGLKSALLLSQMPSDIVGEAIAADKLYDAVNVILSLQNNNGGFASYELTRSYAWLEMINPSETFGDIIIDYQYVECTSAAIQGLKSFVKLHPGHRRKEIEACIAKAANFIESIQLPDGSWIGSWGVCFTYATWFGIKGLVASGKTYHNSYSIRRACDFLLSKQLDSDGWGESYLSCQDKVYSSLDRAHIVNTGWAMLALIEAGQAQRDATPLHRAAKVLTDSSPANFNGPTSPDDSYSSPIGNTFSSPGDARRRSRRRSSTPSAFATPPPNQSRFATSDANPALTPTPSSRRGGRRGGRRATSTTPVNAAATPTSTDDAPASSEGGEGYDADDARPTFVWGTNISVEDVNEAIYRFLKHFRDSSTASQSEDGLLREGKYEIAIKRVIEIEGESLDVNARDVFDYDPDLYTKMVRYPLEVLAIFDIVLMNMVGRINPLFEKHIQTRIFNLKSSTSMRNLNPSDVERMVSLKGMIIRSSSIIPEIREAIFRCLVCGYYSDPVVINRGQITEPKICMKEECQARDSMTLVHNRCRFTDKQIVRLQETPDEIPEGGTPHTVSLLMHDKLVDTGKPGDRVEVTGIYRAMTVRVGPAQRTVKSLFKTYIDCLHIKKTDKSRMLAEDPMDVDNPTGRNVEDISFDEKKVEQLKELSKLPDIYDRLTRSLAPNIWELDDVKKGLLCQLFGGNALKLASGASFRGDINILLVGDPGTSKSQLLQYIHKLSPRGIYTSGRGSSAVGLTAYVAKDPETGETVLESGALVLSDRGICCIDEFDKMSDNARSMLHEVMEQQTVSIAKAGIIASLNARTSVLACANPSGSRYNPRLSVIDNIHLPPTLLSRFDLIYLLLDKADEQTDRRLAKHIVALHFENPESLEQDVLDLSTLTTYVSYARKHIHPQLSDEAAEELTQGYVELRRRGNFPGSSKKVITATPRQIESLIRLSEALARIRFSEWVEKSDVMEAFRLLEVAMQQSATDHSTGTIDMDLITTGVSASERMRRENVLSAIRSIIMEKMQLGGPSMRLLELLEELKKQSPGPEVHLHDLRNAVSTLASEGFVSLHGDTVKRV